MTEQPVTLGDLENQLFSAQSSYEKADMAAIEAARRRDDARDHLHDTQRQIEAKINELRMADGVGIWHDERRQKQAMFDSHHEGGR
jgi:hypothetical protein